MSTPTPFDRVVSHPHIADSFRAVPPHKDGITRAGRAYCPVCGERAGKRSLDISESSSGAVVLKCWRGCSFGEITASLGLDAADLFPQTFDRLSPPGRRTSVGLWQSASSAGDAVEEAGFMLSMSCSIDELHARQIAFEEAMAKFKSAARAALRSDSKKRGAK